MTTAFSYRQRSFTLIELMVALALASIMMSAIVFVFTQSQQVMSAMDAKVIVYNYARSAFDVMEKDLANAQKTGDMEFFQDGTSSPGLIGHYDGLLSGLDAEAIPVRDRGATPHELFPNEKYVYAMTLHQPEPYTDVLGVKHRHDSLYFRSVTSINGLTRPVLIEYALDHSKSSGAPRKLARLVRRTWIVTKIESSGLAGRPRIELNGGAGPNVGPNEPIESELCLYVTDVQIELFFQDKRTNKPGPSSSPRKSLSREPSRPGRRPTSTS
jgi:prepilin-type N-terminal cleavage/methylation domain-containing protein